MAGYAKPVAIDRSFLQGSAARGVSVEFHPSGHLKSAGVRRGKTGAALSLDAAPGSGRFEQRGADFITVEKYHDGAIHGTLNSPWHDGEDYSTPMVWRLWVAQCLSSIGALATARRKTKKR